VLQVVSTKISIVDGSYGGQGPKFFQVEGIGCRRTDLCRGQPGYKDGHGVHRVDGRFELLGIEQAPGSDDRVKPTSQRLQCTVLMLISACTRPYCIPNP
jgi:hypothetical protein